MNKIQVLYSLCQFDRCKLLSRTLLMAMLENRPLRIPDNLLVSMWVAWQTDYAVHVSEEQRKEWTTFFTQYVPESGSILDITMTRNMPVLKATLTALHWDACFLEASLSMGQKVSSSSLLTTAWNLSLARKVVEKICFRDTVGFFSNTIFLFKQSRRNLIRQLREKLQAFPQITVLKKSEMIDWFFLRSLLVWAPEEEHVMWAGGSVHWLMNNEVRHVYDQLEEKHIDIDLFYHSHDLIVKWLHLLEDCLFCKITMTEDRRYADIVQLSDRQVRFRLNFIHAPYDEKSNVDYAMSILERFDLPPCQQGIIWDRSAKHFVHIQTLACSMIHPDHLISVNVGKKDHLKARVEKYIARGCPLVLTTEEETIYGKLSAPLFDEYHSHLEVFPPIEETYALDALPLLFRE